MMRLEPLPIAGVRLIRLTPHEDVRGAFTRLFCRRELESLGMAPMVQINHSLTRQVGTVRGMHFQRPPQAENKLVACLRGRVFDVVVDLRAGSPTFLKWHGVELAEGMGRMLFVPRGVAHGFQVLEADSELLYLHDAFYAPELEGAVNPLEPRIAIAWPLPVSQLSDRDRSRPFLADDFRGLEP
jgi:dTDP-4-dehydrorhamnose 3,5-epimerase